MPSSAGIWPVKPTAGPLANDIDSLKLFMKTMIDAKPALYDGAVIDAPWRSLAKKPKLRLGLLPADPFFPLHPTVEETINKAVKALQSQGHEIVTLDASECRVGEANQIMTQLVTLDTTAGSILAASGEPPVTCLSNFSEKVSNIGWDFLPDLSVKDRLDKYGMLEYIRAEIAEAWRKLWVKHNLDAVISPSAQHTAVEHDNFGWPAYSAFLNLLDVSFGEHMLFIDTSNITQYPACIIPFGKASKIDVEFVAKPGQGAPLCKHTHMLTPSQQNLTLIWQIIPKPLQERPPRFRCLLAACETKSAWPQQRSLTTASSNPLLRSKIDGAGFGSEGIGRGVLFQNV